MSLNIHSLLGLFTRATTRGTPNSCLASNEITRLSSSSPVTAATTSASAAPAAARTSSSHASPRRHATPPWPARRCDIDRRLPGALSISVTSWPGRLQLLGHVATDAAGTGDDDLHRWLPGAVDELVDRRQRRRWRPSCAARRPVARSVSGRGRPASPLRASSTTRMPALVELGDRRAGQRGRDAALDEREARCRVDPVGRHRVGQHVRAARGRWSTRPMATVAMPSRS